MQLETKTTPAKYNGKNHYENPTIQYVLHLVERDNKPIFPANNFRQ
jgi:hypothetical protein